MHSNVKDSPINELRDLWQQYWQKEPHKYISRQMLIRSIKYKQWEEETRGIPPDIQTRLDRLIARYKRDPQCFDQPVHDLKPGTVLIRTYKKKTHKVHVLPDGFEYKEKRYSSLSQLATEITGTRWNGWTFFGLKKEAA